MPEPPGRQLRAALTSESGTWLHALLLPNFGTLLDDNCVTLWSGCNVCEPHLCIRGLTVEANGYHTLSRQQRSGRFPRHHVLNYIIRRALIYANIPCKLELPGLSHSDRMRPVNVNPPAKRERCLIWHATCVA
ncbi:hypothetical protein EVAR_62127_1 [Eumeta japonica]|uniref:Uncharacterized protein n=1 Tax=Eumeta variegata TaxID=151549 RepID=A0A4C1ZZQ0_EUMVA|nr:hypothetical protein EVAR_62127_1 [Eumeta japonica]